MCRIYKRCCRHLCYLLFGCKVSVFFSFNKGNAEINQFTGMQNVKKSHFISLLLGELKRL